MPEQVASDEELAKLLRQFSASSKEVADAARRRFYYSTVKFFDRQALVRTGYNEELAKQAMQEAWIKMMTKPESYDPGKGKVVNWASGIINHCAMDALRFAYKIRKRPRPKVARSEDKDEVEDDYEDEIDDPNDQALRDYEEGAVCPALPADERLYQDQVARATALCIEALPRDHGPNYRLAMELALDPDLTYAQMTDIIQHQMPGETINAEQVRGWVRNAVKRMRACVNAKLGWNKEGK